MKPGCKGGKRWLRQIHGNQFKVIRIMKNQGNMIPPKEKKESTSKQNKGNGALQTTWQKNQNNHLKEAQWTIKEHK